MGDESQLNEWVVSQWQTISERITSGTAITTYAVVRAGRAAGYTGTIPAGQVGLWCSDSSDNSFDDFSVRDYAGPFEIDGRWFCSLGNMRVNDSSSGVLDAYGTALGDE